MKRVGNIWQDVIEIENGNIVLKDGDENIAYWGEQGMNPIEFLKKLML